MSFRRHRKHDDTETALANFALTFAKALLVFCVVLFVMIAPDTKKDDGVKPKMEYLISMSWPGDYDYDIDIWVRDPQGRILWYANKEIGFLNLERDDMGYHNNKVLIDGREVLVKNNEELIAVRGFLPGEYVLNVHLYSAERNYDPNAVIRAVPVTVKIEKINPSVRMIHRSQVVLRRPREEVHVIRFTINADGSMSNFTSDLPVELREKVPSSGGRP